jgi:hypothetical protein
MQERGINVSHKPAFFLKGERLPDEGDEIYATNAEAYQAALTRFEAWGVPTAFTVVESDEPVTCRWDAQRGRVGLGDEKG